MKKILFLVALALVFGFVGLAHAANTDKQQNQNQEGEQVQTANQGQDNQIQTQLQNFDSAEDEDGADVSQSGETLENQNQERNQNSDNSQNQNENGVTNGEARRSQVANAVQEMLQIADRSGGIGEQVRVIAQAQNQNQERLENNLEKIQNRNRVAKFFIGPNYEEVKEAQNNLEQNRERVRQLKEIKTQLGDEADNQSLGEQIQLLEQANAEAEISLDNSTKGFSLLGWLFRFFAR